jgi:type III secretory pathway component EscV
MIVTLPYYKKIEQTMELLKSMQERMEKQIGSLVSKIDINQAKTDANQAKMDITLKETRASQEHLKEEMLAKMEAKIDATQEKMDAWIAEMRIW